MSDNLRYKSDGSYKSDTVTVAPDMADGGVFVDIKTPDGTYVGATIPADILVAILESQGYMVRKVGHEAAYAHTLGKKG